MVYYYDYYYTNQCYIKKKQCLLEHKARVAVKKQVTVHTTKDKLVDHSNFSSKQQLEKRKTETVVHAGLRLSCVHTRDSQQ